MKKIVNFLKRVFCVIYTQNKKGSNFAGFRSLNQVSKLCRSKMFTERSKYSLVPNVTTLVVNLALWFNKPMKSSKRYPCI